MEEILEAMLLLKLNIKIGTQFGHVPLSIIHKFNLCYEQGCVTAGFKVIKLQLLILSILQLQLLLC